MDLLVFGLFALLGYQFSPRLADAGEARFWRIDRAADYGPLDNLSRRNTIKAELIRDNWEDILRVGGSLKLGTVKASDLVRALHAGSKQSELAKAIAEVGRVAKSLFLLSYVDDEAYHRRVLVQLNRHEARHNLARELFHGDRGRVRKRYREGQEDQLSSLGLVLNAVALWNTLYLDRAVLRLRDQGGGAPGRRPRASLPAHARPRARPGPLPLPAPRDGRHGRAEAAARPRRDRRVRAARGPLAPSGPPLQAPFPDRLLHTITTMLIP